MFKKTLIAHLAVTVFLVILAASSAHSQNTPTATDTDSLAQAMQVLGNFDAGNTSDWRLLCAKGLAQDAVNNGRKQGWTIELADVCVAALRWTAHDGKLLAPYMNGTHDDGARFYIDSSTDDAALKTETFFSHGTPQEMWKAGDLTPSEVFDTGFARSFLEKDALPDKPTNLVQLKRWTTSCMNMEAPLSVCAAMGRLQGALAFAARDSVGDYHPSKSQSKDQGPDKGEAETAINNGFISWSSGWSMDRYQRGSAHIDNISCGERGCQATGRFTFFRMGNMLTIPFSADFNYAKDEKYYLDQLCYSDNTTGMRDCTN